MVELQIYKGIDMVDTPRSRDDFISTLQCCEKLMTLTLGVSLSEKASYFEPFLHVVFPKLNHLNCSRISCKHIRLSGHYGLMTLCQTLICL